MVVGLLGDVVIQVTEEQARILEDMVWTGSTRYTTHQLHMQNAVVEATGEDPGEIQFNLTLSREFNVEPMDEMAVLWTYMRNRQTLAFTLGTHGYGRYRWVITNLSNELKHFDAEGNVHHATVTVSLLEYLKEW